MKNRIFSASRRDYWAVVLNNDTPMPDAPAAPSPSPSSMTPMEPTPASTADQMQCCTHCKKSFDVSHFLREQVPGHGNMYYRTQAGGNGLRSWRWCHRCHELHSAARARRAAKQASPPAKHEPSKVHKWTKKVGGQSPLARLGAALLISPDAGASSSPPCPWNVGSPESGLVGSYAGSPPCGNPFGSPPPVVASLPNDVSAGPQVEEENNGLEEAMELEFDLLFPDSDEAEEAQVPQPLPLPATSNASSASDFSLAAIFATISSNIPFDLLNPSKPPAPNSPLTELATAHVQDYARSVRLLQLAARYYPHRKQKRAAFRNEIECLQHIVSREHWYPWQPLLAWVNEYEIASSCDTPTGNVAQFTWHKQLAWSLEARAEENMRAAKEQLMGLLATHGIGEEVGGQFEQLHLRVAEDCRVRGCLGLGAIVEAYEAARMKVPFHKGWEKDAEVSTLPDGFSIGKPKARRARSPTA
jgi:hypothetical protein